MPHQGSYHVDSFAANAEAEIRRLNAQVDLFWPVEGELLLRLGLRDGMAVLDCGCGPGRLLELLQRRLPALRCTGVEIDPLLVEAGRKHLAESGLSGIAIQQGSAETPGLPAASFDFIVMRLVLEHVPDPVAALRSLGALLRPGGRLAVISNDFDFHLRTSPPVPALDVLYAAYCASRRKDGGDPCIGRRVPRLLTEAGFSLVGCEIEIAHNAVSGDGPFLKAEGAGIPAQLVKSGFLDEKTLDDMTRSWRAMLGTPDHCIARPLWVAVGEKSQGEKGQGQKTTGPGAPRNPEPGDKGEDEIAKEPGPTARLTGATSAAPSESAMLTQILALLSETLERGDVDPDSSLPALGIDSISAMMLQERVRDLTGIEVPIVRFFEDTPVRELVSFLKSRPAPGARDRAKPAGPAEGAPRMEEGEL